MEKDIEDWLRQSNELRDPDIVEKREGEGNHNYIVRDGNAKYVLRASKEISDSLLENERKALEFLEQEGVENVPRVIRFESREDGDLLLETYVGEKDLDAEDFTGTLVRDLARLLAEIHSIPLERWEEFTGEEAEAVKNLEQVYLEDFAEWSKEPYREYLKRADSPRGDILELFEKQKELVDNLDFDIEVPQRLTHGDVAFNIRASGDEVFLVDWEFCHAGYPANEVLYFFIHEDLDESQREIFLDEYRKHRELVGFNETKKFYEQFLAFNDMIWAANRVEQGEEQHQELLEDRMERLENMYGEE
jgi:aminoglycoside phosphotransferase (APT) family kinase protein